MVANTDLFKRIAAIALSTDPESKISILLSPTVPDLETASALRRLQSFPKRFLEHVGQRPKKAKPNLYFRANAQFQVAFGILSLLTGTFAPVMLRKIDRPSAQ